MSDVKIREALKEDVPIMLSFIKELAEFEHGLNEVTVTENELLKDGFNEKPLYKCLIAENTNEVLGMAFYFYTYSTWNGKCLYLEDLIVKRNTRTKGVGSVLMKELISIAKREQVKRMSWQVLDWNMDAHDFYKKFNASLDNEWLNGRLSEEQIRSFEES